MVQREKKKTEGIENSPVTSSQQGIDYNPTARPDLAKDFDELQGKVQETHRSGIEDARQLNQELIDRNSDLGDLAKRNGGYQGGPLKKPTSNIITQEDKKAREEDDAAHYQEQSQRILEDVQAKNQTNEPNRSWDYNPIAREDLAKDFENIRENVENNAQEAQSAARQLNQELIDRNADLGDLAKRNGGYQGNPLKGPTSAITTQEEKGVTEEGGTKPSWDYNPTARPDLAEDWEDVKDWVEETKKTVHDNQEQTEKGVNLGDLAKRNGGYQGNPLNPVSMDLASKPKVSQSEAKDDVSPADASSSSMQSINKIYNDNLEELGKNVESLQQQSQKAKADDEVAQRRERNMQMIAGISDGLASIANLIGVGKGGSHIDLSGAMANPKLRERFEAARKERRADIKDIDDRIEQKRRELLDMRTRFGLAQAEQADKEKERADANRRYEEEKRFKEERAKVSDEQWRAEQNFKKNQAEIAKEQWQQTHDTNKENAAADREVRKTQIENDYKARVQQLNQAAEQAGLKGSFPVLIGENEMLDIPKNKINDATIGGIFEKLPKEYQDLAKGKPQYKYEDDGMGGSVKTFAGYAPATLEEKLAAIGAAARDNKDIQDELRKLAGTYKSTQVPQAKKSEPSKQNSQSPQVPKWMQASNKAWQNAASQFDPFLEFE